MFCIHSFLHSEVQLLPKRDSKLQPQRQADAANEIPNNITFPLSMSCGGGGELLLLQPFQLLQRESA